MTYSSLVIFQFVYEYYRIEKQERSLYAFNVTVVPVSRSFSKVCLVPAVAIFIRKFRNKFFCYTTFKSVRIFHQNSTFVAETHVYT